MLGILLAVTSANAFQVQSTGTAQSPTNQAPEIQQPGLSLGDTETIVGPSASQGTEVRIPGLGKLGVLPKMDFGLELLYGATDVPTDAVNAFEEPNGDSDLKVRGTVKHRF
ncbi:MAG: hypothetical protein AAGG72_09180 [Pseudomonadota bacterium]